MPPAVRVLNPEALPKALRTKVPLIARAVRKALPRARGEVNVLLLKDAAMRRLNRKHLAHDYVTDVIAFPYARAPGEPRIASALFGDIAVCVTQAARQARELGVPLLRELLFLAAHGALHLNGYDDAVPGDRARMFRKQDRIVRAILKS